MNNVKPPRKPRCTPTSNYNIVVQARLCRHAQSKFRECHSFDTTEPVTRWELQQALIKGLGRPDTPSACGKKRFIAIFLEGGIEQRWQFQVTETKIGG